REDAAALGDLADAGDGQHDAELRGDVGYVDDLRAGRDRIVEDAHHRVRIRGWSADGEFAHLDASTFFAQLPASPIALMLLVREKHLVARLEVEPEGDEVRAHGGVLRECDFARARVEERAELGAE